MSGNYRNKPIKASGFREAMAWFRPPLKELGALIWPNHCLQCEAVLAQGTGLCLACWRQVSWCHGQCCFGCGAPVEPGPPEEAAEEAICATCAESPPAWHHARAVFRYDGVGRRLVLSLKSRGRSDIVAHAGRWMAALAAPMASPESLIVPVPMHPKRLRERGFNQAALLGRAMIHAGMAGQFAPTLLLRRTHGPKLAHMSSALERYAAIKEGFAVHADSADRLAGRHVVMIDDVLTSGATLDACTRTLFDHGVARVDVVVLARHCRKHERRPLPPSA